jgi:hypothetical protein
MVEEPRPAGCPSDIHVQAGRYDGYEVSVDAAVPSIHDVRGTAPCRTEGWVIGLKLSDYRDVDAAVRNLEPWIVREDLRGEIVLLPSPVPVFRLGAESP